MKYFKFTFLFLLFFSSVIFANSQQTAANKLSELLDQFTTFQSDFTQKTTDIQQQTLQRSNGLVMIERPGCFRWETKNPSHQIVITNGKKLWVYDVDLKQATEQSIANSTMNPAKLLSGNIDDLLNQFTVRMIPHKNIVVFQLIPKQPNQQFQSIAMAFSHDKLTSMQIENNMQQTTVFDFADIKLNTYFPSSLFEFTAPSGVNVMQ